MILDAPNIVALTPQPWHHLARIVPTPPWPAVAPEASRCAAWRKRRHRGTTQRPIAHLHLRSTWNRLNWMKLDKIGTLGHCTYKNLHFTQKNVDFKKRTKNVILRVNQSIQPANLGFLTIIKNQENWGFKPQNWIDLRADISGTNQQIGGSKWVSDPNKEIGDLHGQKW